MILGNDLPVLLDLLQPEQLCNVVVTRAKMKRAEEHMSALSTLPFFDVDIEVEPSMSQKSRSERSRDKLANNASKTPANPSCDLLSKFPGAH